MPDTSIPPLAEAIRQAIAVSNVKVKDIAEYLNVDASTVTRYMQGNRTPDITTVLRIEQILGLRRGELFTLGLDFDLPIKPEDIAQFDPRLDAAHRSLARSYYRACIKDSQPSRSSMVAPDEVRNNETTLFSTTA